MRLKDKLLGSTMFRNVATLTSGTALSQLIIVLSSPILSRIYNGEAYGLYGTFISIGIVLAGVCTLRYEFAIVLEKKTKDSILIARTAGLFNVIFFLAVSVISFIFGSFIIDSFNLNLEKSNVILIGIYPLLVGMNNLYGYLFTKDEKFAYISYTQITKSVFVVASQLLISLIMNDYFGLLLGQFIGLFASLLLSTILFKRTDKLFYNAFDWSTSKALLRKHIRFPKYNLPQNFINSISQNLPTLLLTSFFSLEVAGFYWFTARILNMPISVFGNAVRKVFFKRASDLHNSNKSFKSLFLKSTFGLLIAGVIPSAVLFFFGEILFELIFGQEWIEAGSYSQYLVLSLTLGALPNAPAVMSIQILDKQKYMLGLEILLIVSRAVAIYSGTLFDSPLVSIQLFVAAGLIVNWIIIFIGYFFVSTKTLAN